MSKLLKLRDFNNGKIQVTDQVELPTQSTRTLTPEGYLKATAAVTKIGIQLYCARDFGIDSDEKIGVFRPAETVFHPETIESLKMKPIVLLHPEQDVNSTNHSRLAIGSVGEKVEAIDSERLGASIQITDDAIVKQILGREVEELSLGYDVFIISEEGSFLGQDYVYKMDGPMLNNHLAIVPEGRCGDSVKILDKGEDNVNKTQMIKKLKDAGVSEENIKLFMVGAKDTDKGDFEAYTKMLLTAKDIDISALIPGIVAELKPELEKLVASPEFTNILAKEIAATMGAATPTAPPEGDADPNAEEDPMTKEALDAKIKDSANTRARLIDTATPFVKKDKSFKIYDATNREIMEKALENVGFAKEEMKDKADDYLLGILNTVSTDRTKANEFMNKDWSADSSSVLSKPMTAINFKQAANA